MTIDRYVQAIADANGTATARVPGPTNAGQTWELLSMQVASTSTARTEARVYADAVSPTNLRGQSRDGRLDSATGEGETVRAGAVLIVQWIGADVGAVCTATALFREA